MEAAAHLDEWVADVLDHRPRAKTGFPALDGLLRKQSFGPGNLVFLAGRMHTRKTAVMLNMVCNMLRDGVPVGLVGLDEAPFMYVAKLCSVMTHRSHLDLDDSIKMAAAMDPVLKQQYESMAKKLSLFTKTRPTLLDLGDWLTEVKFRTGETPRVVFIDYLMLLRRDNTRGGEAERVRQLCEDLQVWTNQHQVTTVALHQVGRQGDDAFTREHGSRPITPEQLMYAGEQAADIILSTYRPALDPFGNMTEEEALAQGRAQQDWQNARDRVVAFQQDTMLQLTKNRPGLHLEPRGIRLRSVKESQKMEVVT